MVSASMLAHGNVLLVGIALSWFLVKIKLLVFVTLVSIIAVEQEEPL